jgi:broad specificity phosphatase PhoE
MPEAVQTNSRELTSTEKRFLTPTFASVESFWSSGWREDHRDALIVYLIRHRESIMNLRQVSARHDAFAPGTFSRGRRQSEHLAQFLAETPFAMLVSSDSERTYRTLEILWKRQGNSGLMPFDYRLAEATMYPVGGVPNEVARQVFDPHHHYDRFPEFFVNVRQESLTVYRQNVASLLAGLIDRDEFRGANVALCTHSGTIVLQLMEMGAIPMTRHRATVDFVSPSGSKCPHVGVNVCGYLPEQRQWQVLVLRDNSYLPEDLQRPPTGWQRILIEFIAQWQVLTRRLQYLLGGK